MNMLPVFIAGMLNGTLLATAWFSLRKDTSSETKIRLQQREIEQLKRDNAMVTKVNDDLYLKIEELKATISKNMEK